MATKDETARKRSKLRQSVAELPGWKRSLVGVSLGVVLLGLVLQGASLLAEKKPSSVERPGTPANTPQKTGIEGQGYLPGGPTDPTEPRTGDGTIGDPPAEPSALDRWSPVLVKGGLGFLVGFSIGFALRTFAKVSAVVAGTVFLAILLLAWAGAISVDWARLEGWWNDFAAWLRPQVESFAAFVRGSVPSVGLAGFGLFTGVKRK